MKPKSKYIRKLSDKTKPKHSRRPNDKVELGFVRRQRNWAYLFTIRRYVDLEELQAWSLKAFDSFESDDAYEEFRTIDADKDGIVSWSEFVADMFGEEFSEEDADSKNLHLFKKDQKLFAAADMNQDQQLDLSEFVTFRIPRRHPSTKQIVYEDTMELYDLDKDGSINLEEFLREAAHDPDDTDFIESETERFKVELDTDGDGMLAGDEIFRWIDPDNKEDADDEADHLMTECDADKDNRLSASEILNNHDIWVESDATDYGKQLLMNHDEF